MLEYILVSVNQDMFVTLIQSPSKDIALLFFEVLLLPALFYVIGKKKGLFKSEFSLYTNEYMDTLDENEKQIILQHEKRIFAVIDWLKKYLLILLLIMTVLFTRALICRILLTYQHIY